jgi:hypothetical protein
MRGTRYQTALIVESLSLACAWSPYGTFVERTEKLHYGRWEPAGYVVWFVSSEILRSDSSNAREGENRRERRQNS